MVVHSDLDEQGRQPDDHAAAECSRESALPEGARRNLNSLGDMAEEEAFLLRLLVTHMRIYSLLEKEEEEMKRKKKEARKREQRGPRNKAPVRRIEHKFFTFELGGHKCYKETVWYCDDSD